MKALILDDEPRSVLNLQLKLEMICPDVHLIASFSSPDRAEEFLQHNEIDVLFLDIKMPNTDGFEFLTKIGYSDETFRVILITAFEEFALTGYRYNAIDYLLKPVDLQELQGAVEKVRKSLLKNEPNAAPKFSAPLSESKDLFHTEKISISSTDQIEFISPSDIIYCKSDSNYTIIYLEGDTERVIAKTLKNFEETLTPYAFFRMHHSYLINLQHVRSFQRSDHVVEMKNGHMLPVARSRKDAFLKFFT